MTRLLRALRRWWHPGELDRLEGEIDEELASHLEHHAEQARRDGASEEEARAAARERFGPFDEIRRACRGQRGWEVLMLQRIHVAVTLLALLAAALLGWQLLETRRALEARGAVAAKEAAGERDWVAAFDEAPGWRGALGLANEIVLLPGDRALEAARDVLQRASVPEKRKQVLKAFAFARHPALLELLEAGMDDESPEVREWAAAYLEPYSGKAVAHDPTAARAWLDEHAHRPFAEVVRERYAERIAQLNRLDGPEVLREMLPFGTDARVELGLDLRDARAAGLDGPALLRAAGALELAARWLESGDPGLRSCGAHLAGEAGAGEAFAREHLLPALADPTGTPRGVLLRVARAVGAPGNDWALEPLLGAMRSLPPGPESEGRFIALAAAVGELGAPEAIPELIGILAADDIRETRHAIGNYALQPLAGVPFDLGHDAAWWRDWWARNRGEFRSPVSEREIPEVRLPG